MVEAPVLAIGPIVAIVDYAPFNTENEHETFRV